MQRKGEQHEAHIDFSFRGFTFHIFVQLLWRRILQLHDHRNKLKAQPKRIKAIELLNLIEIRKQIKADVWIPFTVVGKKNLTSARSVASWISITLVRRHFTNNKKLSASLICFLLCEMSLTVTLNFFGTRKLDFQAFNKFQLSSQHFMLLMREEIYSGAKIIEDWFKFIRIKN